MDIFSFQKNTHLAAVYYNNKKSNLFRIKVDVTLVDLKHQLDQLNGRLKCRDARRVVNIERDVGEICSRFIRPRTFDEIAACMVEPEDNEDEVFNLSDP
ncbi:hypothetical protein A2U01_0035916 [Trifolium medium]|uniref:Uncharacterized protein n=1 Tax=Trifolium medium TaxID=97028 RepID=A0A392PSH9_9FABA|nr:hypothetical protein [Trifolium medium]